MVTKEQEEEFKRRKASGPKVPPDEVEEFNKNGVKLTLEQHQSFLEATTDEKLNGSNS